MNWLKYSGIWFSFALNPFHWRLDSGFDGPTDMDPAQYHAFIIVGPLTIRIVIDDGSY
jgi:hypothetical protein